MTAQRRIECLKRLAPLALPAGVGVAALLLYLSTLAPGTVYLQDTSEFQTKLYNLEVIHATGYPLYQMVGKAWVTLLPIGSIAWRTNLLSAVLAAAALVCLCRILQQSGTRFWAIALACALLASSVLTWSHAIMASAYPLHILLVALSTLTLLRWLDGRGSPAWFALACGAGLAHHRVFAINLPVFALIILRERRQIGLRARQWFGLGLLALTPVLVSWAWLALLGVWPPDRLFRFLFVEGSGFFRSPNSLAALIERIGGRVWPWLVEPYGLLPLLTGLAGLLWQARPRAEAAPRRTALLLLGLGTATAVFSSLAWVAPDDRRYFAQWDMVLAAGWGLFWDGLWDRLRRPLRRPWLRWAGQAVLATVALLPLISLYPASLAAHAHLRDGYADRVSRQILATVESEATVFGNWVSGWPLAYYTTVEQLRPDVRVVVEPGDAHRSEAITLADAGAPVYFRQRMYGLDWETSGYVWAPLDTGHLYRALPTLPPLAHAETVSHTFDNGAILTGVGFSVWPLQADTFVRLWLGWEGTPLAPETALTLQLTDGAGRAYWRYDATWEHLAGEDPLQTDVYWITPPTLAPGDYTLHLALGEPDAPGSLGEIQLRSIPVAAGPALTGDRLVIENRLASPEPIPPHDPDLQLLGYGFLDQELWAGHLVPLSLFWEVDQASDSLYTISFAVETNGEQIPVGAGCPVPSSYAGGLVESACALSVPPGVTDGRYQLVATVDDGREAWDVTLRRVSVHDRPRVYRAPRMQTELGAALGTGISLLGYDLQPSSVQPGQDLTLTLYWRAESAGNAEFKVFVHLVGPDGGLLSQHDGMPAEGTAPTSQWLDGEVVADGHVVPIPTDAPAGEYTLYTGMYAPDSGDRLPAADADGNPYLNNAIPLQTIVVAPSSSGQAIHSVDTTDGPSSAVAFLSVEERVR